MRCSVGVSVCLVCCVFDSVCELFGAYCACVPSVHLSIPSIGFVCVLYVESISSFKSLRAESQVFALLLLFLCVILHIMWSGKSLQLLCILPFGMLCLSAIHMMFVKSMLAVCMLVGMVV